MALESLIQKISEMNPILGNQIQAYPWMLPILILQVLTKIIIYPIALYHSAKRHKKGWFIILFIGFLFLNDFGIFPLLYLIFNRDRKAQKVQKTKKAAAKKK